MIRRRYMVGVDESGVGALAGPVAVACYVTDTFDPSSVLDVPKKHRSKSVRVRNDVRVAVTAAAAFQVVVYRERIDIDMQGLGVALASAVDEVVQKASTYLREKNASRKDVLFVFDGEAPWCVSACQRLGVCGVQIPKADDTLFEAAAAGFLAYEGLVERFKAIDSQHPEWGFARHMGYPTTEHRRYLQMHGPTPEHRLTTRTVGDRQAAALELRA